MKINKPHFIKFRVDAFERDFIKSKSEEYGLSTSEYIRRCAMNQKIRPRMTDEEFEIFQNMHKFKRDFQNISNLFSKRDPGLSKKVQELATKMQEHLDKING